MAQPLGKILFASPHSIIDWSSGAAVATSDIVNLLGKSGFTCQAFCASKLDLPADTSFEQLLVNLRVPCTILTGTYRGVHQRLLQAQVGALPVTIFRTRSTSVADWDAIEPEAMIAAYVDILERTAPDMVLTYGGDPVAHAIIRLASERGIPVVFGLHNLAYDDPRAFDGVERVIVPSRFAANFYRETLGLACDVLPSAIDWNRVKVEHPRPQYATFVNPQPAKGLNVFARIAHEVACRRPDIPLLVVDARGDAQSLQRTGIDLSGARNLYSMQNTHDPRDFYAVTKLLLMPSLCNESFGLVAAEAMMNGIPVLASNRGALPEVVGDAAFIFSIPDRYQPDSSAIPSADEVLPWVETIERLWDDRSFYDACSAKAHVRAKCWEWSQIGPSYGSFFRSVVAKRRLPFP